MIANTSSGIEPIIAVAYTRRALDQKFPVFDPLFREMAEDRGIDPAQIAERIAETGSVQNVKEVPDDLKALFRTAYEVPAEQHVRIQAAVQKFTDNAVSKTVNLPTNTTVEDVKRIFLLAHKLNCKGLTVFRKGSRPGALDVGERVRESVSMRERPKIAFGETEKFKTGCGSLYVHLNHGEEGLLLESFCNLGKGGGWTAQSEAMARLVSLCLRCGVDPKEVVRQLRAIRCPTACSARAAGKPVDALSCPDAIAQAIGRPICAKTDRMSTDETLEFCPVCGGPREPGRCGICLSCWKGGCQPA
jgi:ribonucleoside-diphosphate reductase alpha chain